MDILEFLKTQGWTPQLGQAPPHHLTATEQTADALPQFNTSSAQFQPQSIGPDLPLTMRALSAPGEQIRVAPAKPWAPPAEKCGAVPQQDELIELSRGETSVRFDNTALNFQQVGLAVRRRSDAVSQVQEQATKTGAAVNRIIAASRADLEKRQRQSGEWPAGFEREGCGARCPDCRKFFWGTVPAWKHVQAVCPIVKRITETLAAYRPCTLG